MTFYTNIYKDGDVRKRKKFAFLPISCPNYANNKIKWVWLEYVLIKEIFTMFPLGKGFWVTRSVETI